MKVKLPDNLTEWRFTAIGVTDATAVGMDRAKIIAKKPVMVRLNLPRFLVQGDEIETSITFHNDSGSTQKMHASLELTGLSTKASKRIDFE
ncbi:alpha-2-macroglobulin family protein, partial [Klebsiella pneumoniae]